MSPARALLQLDGAGSLAVTRAGVRAGGSFTLAADGSAAGGLAADALADGAAAGGFTLTATPDIGAREATFRIAVANPGDAPARLDAVVLGFRWSGAGLASHRFLRHGWQSWSVCTARALEDETEPPFPSGPWLRGHFHALGSPPADRAGWHESDLLTVVGAPQDGPACSLGALEEGQAYGVVFARREGEDVALEIELVVDATLPPGQRRELDAVRVALGRDATALLEQHAEAHGRQSNARTHAAFQAGWCSWYHFFHEISEADLLRNLEALAANRDALPIDLVQLDDGYQRAIGDWRETNEKFPRGLAPIAEDIRSAGFQAGLWTAPFLATPDSRIHAEHPEWLLRDGDAPWVAMLHPVWNPDGAVVHALDTSQQPVLSHLARVFAELTAFGFDYHKIDFLFAVSGVCDAADPAVSRAARLRRGLLAIRRGVGDDAFVLGCGCPLGPAVGLVDGMRIGPDVAPSWEVAPPNIPIPGIERTQPSTRNGIRNIYKRAFLHRRLWLNDPDCLMSRTSDTALTESEARSLAAAMAVTGGMVVFSDDVPKLTDESRALVADTVALAREVDRQGPAGEVRTLGLLDTPSALGAAAPADGGALVALFNEGDVPARRELLLHGAGIGLRAADREVVLGTAAEGLDGGDGRLAASVAPHATGLVRLTGDLPVGVFCDFDGTFAVQDVGATLAMQYAADRRPALWQRYERGELNAWEYNMELLDGIAIPEDELEAFLRTIELDPGAQDLVSWCDAQAVPFCILSDGFDHNLERLRVLTGVPFAYAGNHLRYEAGCWRITPAAPDPDCMCGTGLCKRGRIRRWRARHPDARVVYIGNGRVSDRCASHEADLVFAKDTLAPALDADGVAYERYETLHDVLPVVREYYAQQV